MCGGPGMSIMCGGPGMAEQTMMGGMPAGNIQISAAILFTGASNTRELRVFDAAGILCIKPSTYKDHKRVYLEPTIWTVWVNHQQKLCDQLQAMPAGLIFGGDGHTDSPGHSAKYGSYTMKLCDQLQAMPAGLIFGGDGRADSPGHSAKYGSYTMMELRINNVIDIQLVQCNEVGCTNAMEKKLEELGLAMHTLITDRHPHIQKYAMENLPTVNHFYDAWHVAKGFVRRVERLTKKGCPELQPWLKLCVSALYYNENANRKQAINKDGEPVFMINFPKFKKEYVDELMAIIFDQVLDDGRVYALWKEVEAIVPANMCSQYERPNDIDVIKQQSSRFAKSNEPCLPDQNLICMSQ